jgi:hypothetical protein
VPESDDRNSIGRGVLARSEDDGRMFSEVVPMPLGFAYSTAINAWLQADLPEDQRGGIFIFGVPRYRASVPYLARAPIAFLAIQSQGALKTSITSPSTRNPHPTTPELHIAAHKCCDIRTVRRTSTE